MDVTSDVLIQMSSVSKLGKIISNSSRKEISKTNKRQRLRPPFGEPNKIILRSAYRKLFCRGFSIEATSTKCKIKSSCSFQVQHRGRLKPPGKRVDSGPEICDRKTSLSPK